MKQKSILVIILLALWSCSSCAPAFTNTPSIITKKPLTHSVTPSPTSSKSTANVIISTIIPTKTKIKLEPTLTILPTPITLSESRISTIENSGYVRAQLKQVQSTSDPNSINEDGVNDISVPQLTLGKYSYIQYDSETHNNCILIFTIFSNNKTQVLSIIEPIHLSGRINEALRDPIVLFICEPYFWGDLNKNGRPDLAISFNWAFQYTGSEVHIFEVDDNDTISDITANLPGIVSPWTFNPYQSETQIKVIDTVWASHDCIYPPIEIYWIYDWRDGKYIDITSELDLNEVLRQLKNKLAGNYGKPISSSGVIGDMVELLLLYDHSGQRDVGWQEYQEISNPSNWPGTDENYLKLLKSDINHFEKQYREKIPFTPNDVCLGL